MATVRPNKVVERSGRVALGQTGGLGLLAAVDVVEDGLRQLPARDLLGFFDGSKAPHLGSVDSKPGGEQG
jgi:hypothetical protein